MLNKLAWLEESFDDVLPRALSHNLANFYKLRVGDWRVVYKVVLEAEEISIAVIDHRRNIYQRDFS